jgi:hypothetical protein
VNGCLSDKIATIEMKAQGLLNVIPDKVIDKLNLQIRLTSARSTRW